ncbi:M24 family metallopeptidase [Maritimibacter dapengensis]|uniref:Xaa-Pro peptidase family protein n=1 Tax=Maritimibacter dapengensis TaxID=2836868 RepID=A0ABS6T6X0_9RHOB|nr:Xaa-Pro peptidase family protein [Maritimibacter dapengensis]MBV7380433.1 Xaa-Pro peptidase family protein [Maritimibacter dapengensis]
MANFDWHAERSDLHGIALLDRAPESEGIDLAAVRLYRLGRVRAEMEKRGIGAMILSDSVNIRYATGTRNMQVFTSRNTPSRYLVLTQNRSILFEFTGAEHLGEGYETVDEVRPAKTASFVAAGPHIAQREIDWATEMDALVTELAGKDAVLAMERMNAGVAIAIHMLGRRIVDAQEPVEMARAIKSPEEIKCVYASLRATEVAVGKMRDAICPGVTENQLWSVLHKSVIEQNADYCETRLLNSGGRTNPWYQESSNREIGENELIALDTDVVGCHGYYSDFSRTFHSGPGKPTDAQRELYQTAYEQVHANMAILKPGLSFRDYAEAAWDIPEKFYKHRYYLSAHGCGMTGEYPYLYHRGDFPDAGYDGVIEPGMVICVESFIGGETGEGVKVEEQVLVTETGIEVMSRFPFEESLLAREV